MMPGAAADTSEKTDEAAAYPLIFTWLKLPEWSQVSGR
jgi:hypothetical protein